jgi:integrase/recombinase XerD
MLEKPISPLRQRMIDDMTARRFKEKVQKDYVRHVRTFAAFLGRSPDTATSEDLRRFQLHMAQQQISAGSINAAVAALRCFFNVTLERPDLVPASCMREMDRRRACRDGGKLTISPIACWPATGAEARSAL